MPFQQCHRAWVCDAWNQFIHESLGIIVHLFTTKVKEEPSNQYRMMHHNTKQMQPIKWKRGGTSSISSSMSSSQVEASESITYLALGGAEVALVALLVVAPSNRGHQWISGASVGFQGSDKGPPTRFASHRAALGSHILNLNLWEIAKEKFFFVTGPPIQEYAVFWLMKTVTFTQFTREHRL